MRVMFVAQEPYRAAQRVRRFGNNDNDPTQQALIKASTAIHPFFTDELLPQMAFSPNPKGPGWALRLNGVTDADGQLTLKLAEALKKEFGDIPVQLTLSERVARPL